MKNLKQRGQGLIEILIAIAIVLGLLWCLVALLQTPNRISDERALTRIAEMKEVDRSQITVLYKTDNSVWTGDPSDVQYDLEIGSERFSARCSVTSWFSDMVCRTYELGSGD